VTAADWEAEELPLPRVFTSVPSSWATARPVLNQDAVTAALLRVWTERYADRTEATARDHCTAMAAAVVELARPEQAVKAEALREAAGVQRQLAAASAANGRAEHEDIADWLDERAEHIAGDPS
jgi:hypothetical protein